MPRGVRQCATRIDVPAFLHTFTFHASGFLTLAEDSPVVRDGDSWKLNAAYVPPADVSFLVFQLERTPSGGRVHLQGAIEFVVGCSTLDIQRRMDCWSHREIHYEQAMGSRDQQIAYCSKVETRLNADELPFIFQHTERMQQVDAISVHRVPQAPLRRRGRPQLPEGEQMARREKTLENKIGRMTVLHDIISKCSGLYEMWLACTSALRSETDIERRECLISTLNKILMNGNVIAKINHELRADMAKQRNLSVQRQVDVRLYWGGPGRGKTTAALTRYAGKGIYSHKVGSDGPWFCNYTGEPVLILDEMGGALHPQCSPEMLLTWLSGDPAQLQRKGKEPVYAAWFCVVLISNYPFNEWFGHFAPPRFTTTFKAALLSRIPHENVEHFNSDIDFRQNVDGDRWEMQTSGNAELKKMTYAEMNSFEYRPVPVGVDLSCFTSSASNVREPDVVRPEAEVIEM